MKPAGHFQHRLLERALAGSGQVGAIGKTRGITAGIAETSHDRARSPSSGRESLPAHRPRREAAGQAHRGCRAAQDPSPCLRCLRREKSLVSAGSKTCQGRPGAARRDPTIACRCIRRARDRRGRTKILRASLPGTLSAPLHFSVNSETGLPWPSMIITAASSNGEGWNTL